MLKNLFERAFISRRVRPERDRTPRIAAPPHDATLNALRPRGSEIVHARLATSDGTIENGEDTLRYRAGDHYLVQYQNGDDAPVARRIFEATYRRRQDGAYEKRPDLILQFFTMPHAVIVETLEGDKRAEAGDWIMRGVIGELYPIAEQLGEAKYERV